MKYAATRIKAVRNALVISVDGSTPTARESSPAPSTGRLKPA
ncbi:MAG: hypothetical protein ACLQCB_13070 [Spirochaetia bacterium]